MSTCEKCYADSRLRGVSYFVVLNERESSPCSPEDQAGPEAKECPTCKRMTLHQHTGECMALCGYVQPQSAEQHEKV